MTGETTLSSRTAVARLRLLVLGTILLLLCTGILALWILLNDLDHEAWHFSGFCHLHIALFAVRTLAQRLLATAAWHTLGRQLNGLETWLVTTLKLFQIPLTTRGASLALLITSAHSEPALG